jgi:hypothetical protein
MSTELGTKITVEDAAKLLNENIEQLIDSENYKETLKIMSRVRNYSPNNTMLIGMQRPDATVVMGYNEWKKLGRQVKKGETAIKILAPLVKKFEEEKKDPKTGQPILKNGEPVKEEKKGIAGYRAVNVFDVSQTEGKEMVSTRQVVASALQEDEYMSKLYEDYKAFLNENKLPVTEEPAKSTEYGYYHLVDHKIVISNDLEGLTDSRKFKTLIHEYAHASLHGKGAEYSNVGRSYAEVQAESVAFVVSNYYGLDTGDVSNGYVASWGKNPELIRQAINEIQEVSSEIIEEINALQKDKLQEYEVDQKQDYENVKKYLVEEVGLKKEVFESENAGTTTLQLIHREHGVIASGTLQFNEKNDSWYVRTNRNMNEPLTEIGKDGKFAVLNVEQEINEVKSYTDYARIATHYSVQQVKEGIYVVQLTAGQDLYKASTEVENKKLQPNRNDSPIISKTYETKEDAQEFKMRASMAQALQEEMVTTKHMKDVSRQRELEFTLNEIRKNVASQVSEYVGHHSNRSVTFSTEGSTKVGWAVLRNPQIKSLDDLQSFAKEKSGLVSGRQIQKALNEAKINEIEKENKKEKVQKRQSVEIEREITR